MIHMLTRSAIALSVTCSAAAQRSPNEALDLLHERASAADADGYFALYTSDARFLGTDRHERWSRAEFEALFRPYMESGRGWTYHPRDRHVEQKGSLAWFDETLWHESYRFCRGSGILEQIDGRWLVRQYNLTFPVPNEIARDAIGIGLTHEQSRLRAMTFNIRYNTARDGRHAWPNRSTEAISLVRRTAPDVVGLQEVLPGQLAEFSAAMPGYVRLGAGRDDGFERGEFAPIFVLTDRFEVLNSSTFWFSDTPEDPGSKSYGNTIPRICTWAELRELSSDRRLVVANVHLDHASAESRVRSLEQFERWAEAFHDIPMIVMGDFNTSPSSDAAEAIADSFEIVAPEGPTYHGFSGHDDLSGHPIDWFAERGELEQISVEAMREANRLGDDRYASDHDPVLATFRWPE